MACPEIDELERYETGALDPLQSESVRAHLPGCPTCERRLQEVRDNLALARAAREHLGAGRARGAAAVRAGASREPAPPEHVAGFRIVRELGRGGTGVVYLAEQEHPRRAVALKLIRPGADPAATARRLAYEANVLAQLHHPGIAQVYETGIVAQGKGTGFEGQPYFALEFVDGPRLDRYAEDHQLSPAARLELLARVCDAVHHAHQKGVIHRDLNPNNILVESDQPKVLDFGVARITDTDMQTMTMHTTAGQLIGTVPFMSPEQVAGNAADLDTRSDVYALGVIGYVLLAGRLPYDLRGRSIPEAARIIRDEPPARIRTLKPGLDADIETILLKALEKDRERRYASAAELAADLRRYLGREPILARPPSASYQVKRFAQRSPALAAALAGLVLVLITASAAGITLALRATRAQHVAREEAAKSDAVKTFLQDMLVAVSPEENPGRTDVTVREVLAQAGRDIDAGSLTAQPAIEVGVRTSIGDAYRALGDYDRATPHLERAVALAREHYPHGHEDRVLATNKLARVYSSRARYDEAEALFRECLEIRERLLGPGHELVAVILNNLADVLRIRGALDESLALHEQALEIRRQRLGPEHEDIANSLNNIAAIHYGAQRLDEAARYFRESLEMDVRLRGEKNTSAAITMSNLAAVLTELGQEDEARQLIERSLALHRDIYGADHPKVATVLNNLALQDVRQGRLDDAERHFGEALTIYRRRLGDRHPEIATTLGNLAGVHERRGDLTSGTRLRRQALGIREAAFGPEHALSLSARANLAAGLCRRGGTGEAERMFRDVLKTAGDALPAGHILHGVLRRDFGRCLAEQQRRGEAETLLLDAHARLVKSAGADHGVTRSVEESLAKLYEAMGRAEEARAWGERQPGRPS